MPPFLDSALKRAQLAIGEDAGVFGLESGEEDFPDAVRLGLEPRVHPRPGGLEGIGSRAPIARRSRREPMGRTDLALLPRRGQPCKKAVETARVARRQMSGVTGGQFREVVLHGADLFEEL